MNQREIEIRGIAYSIWEREGRPVGRETAHWLEAEGIWEERQRLADGAPAATGSTHERKARQTDTGPGQRTAVKRPRTGTREGRM